ncbi:MAG TPA: hypothetical protein VMF32_17110 [Xanthobacteraceae bacterium]|nr:hypothetical protein [Xanthobacteraceae bacterium]
MPWDEGADDCAKHPHPQLGVRRYDARTFVLGEDLRSTWEVPFMYLLIGDKRALLVDADDVAAVKKMPLAWRVIDLMLLISRGPQHLIVVHTHRHLDHRSGDGQFQLFAKTVTVVVLALPATLAKFNGFYRRIDNFIMIDPMRDLLVAVIGAFAVFGADGRGDSRLQALAPRPGARGHCAIAQLSIDKTSGKARSLFALHCSNT